MSERKAIVERESSGQKYNTRLSEMVQVKNGVRQSVNTFHGSKIIRNKISNIKHSRLQNCGFVLYKKIQPKLSLVQSTTHCSITNDFFSFLSQNSGF